MLSRVPVFCRSSGKRVEQCDCLRCAPSLSSKAQRQIGCSKYDAEAVKNQKRRMSAKVTL